MSLNPAVVPESPFAAFRTVCYLYGIDQLAKALGMKRGTLYNKADADVDSHNQPTLRDVISVTQITGNTLVLESLERMFHRTGFDMPAASPSDEALLELLCKVGSEQGAMYQALHNGLADKKYTEADHRALRAEAFDVINAVLVLLNRAEGLIDG